MYIHVHLLVSVQVKEFKFYEENSRIITEILLD